tara:strand:+ start:446 stop:745 length:300 start_codon:yes stop_codon:yes gene_type:complete
VKTNKKIEKIIKEIQSLDKLKNIKYIFSYISIGDNLSELQSEVVDNLGEDIPSNALLHVIDEKIFGNPIVKTEEEMDMEEVSAKLHMFNLFNKGKNYKA